MTTPQKAGRGWILLVAVLAAALTHSGTAPTLARDAGRSLIVFEKDPPSGGRDLTMLQAVAVARSHLGDSDATLLEVRNVSGPSSPSGRDRTWLASFAHLDRESHVLIEAGVVTRVEESPLRVDVRPVEATVDTPQAAGIARGAGLEPHAPKVNGFGYSLRTLDGKASLAVLGSASGFTARIEVDPASGTVLSREQLVPADTGGLIFSPDSGMRWEATDLTGMVFAMTTDETGAYAIEESRGGSTLWHSPDGRMWSERAKLPLLDGHRVFALVSTGDGALLAGTTDGVMRSDDGGREWHAAGLIGPVQFLAADTSGRVVATVTAGPGLGSFELREPGEWTALGSADRVVTAGESIYLIDERLGVARALGHAATAVTLPLRTLRLGNVGEALIAATPEAVYRSTDSGVSWRKTLQQPTASLLVLPNGVVIVGGLRSPTYRSTDGGETWAVVLERASSLCAGGDEIVGLRQLGEGVIGIHGGALTWQTF